MEKTDIEKEIQKIIDKKINPILNEHMGGVVLREFKKRQMQAKMAKKR